MDIGSTDTSFVSQDHHDIFEDFDKKMASSRPEENSTSAAIAEVHRYLEDIPLPRQEDPLLWYKQHQHIYPNLSSLVKTKMNMLAASVPCERILSKSGTIVSDRRTRLSSQHVEKLLFLNTNSYLIDDNV